MLRTSIADVVNGCFDSRPLDCDIAFMVVDCAAVETVCMLEKYVTSPLLLLSFASVAVAADEKGYVFLFLVELLLMLLIIFVGGCATAAAGACAASNVSTEAERGTGYSFFLSRFCPLDCVASDVYCCCCHWLLLFSSSRPRYCGYSS